MRASSHVHGPAARGGALCPHIHSKPTAWRRRRLEGRACQGVHSSAPCISAFLFLLDLSFGCHCAIVVFLKDLSKYTLQILFFFPPSFSPIQRQPRLWRLRWTTAISFPSLSLVCRQRSISGARLLPICICLFYRIYAYTYTYICIPSFLSLLISFPFGHFFLIYTTFMLIVFVYVYSLEYIFLKM